MNIYEAAITYSADQLLVLLAEEAEKNVELRMRLAKAEEALSAQPDAVDGGVAFRLTALRSNLTETLYWARMAGETDAERNIGLDLKTLDSIIEDVLAAHPQPAAAKDGDGI